MPGAKRGSGTRSNSYSESKCTNWSSFDPFHLEVYGSSAGRPTLVWGDGDGKVPIYVADLHEAFVRPVEARDVSQVLDHVPTKFLKGLAGIWLLGGTTKQAKSHLLRYGCYRDDGWIYLHAFKKSWLSQRWGRKPKPSTVEEYLRAGAQWVREESGWCLQFNPVSLKRFYLYDVLLHELGHHVDHRISSRNKRAAEAYAEWFAREQARALSKTL